VDAAAAALVEYGVEEKTANQFAGKNPTITPELIDLGKRLIAKRPRVTNPPMYLLTWLQSESAAKELSKLNTKKIASQNAAREESARAQALVNHRAKAADDKRAALAELGKMSELEYRAALERFANVRPAMFKQMTLAMKRIDAQQNQAFLLFITTPNKRS
jgi:hypothetical protein